MITVRMARKEDARELLPLLEQLGYPTTFDELEKRFESFVGHEGYGVAVATLADKIVGCVAWSTAQLFVLDGTRFRIEGLVVDEQYRRHGAGKKLMLFVEQFATQFNSPVIELTSGLRRASSGAHEFYKALGYQNEGPKAKLYLRKKL